jgi:hypothetical protein
MKMTIDEKLTAKLKGPPREVILELDGGLRAYSLGEESGRYAQLLHLSDLLETEALEMETEALVSLILIEIADWTDWEQRDAPTKLRWLGDLLISVQAIPPKCLYLTPESLLKLVEQRLACP